MVRAFSGDYSVALSFPPPPPYRSFITHIHYFMGKFYLSASQSPLIDGEFRSFIAFNQWVDLFQSFNRTERIMQCMRLVILPIRQFPNLLETTFIIPINQELTNVGEHPMTREDNKSGIDGVPVKGQGPEQPMGHIYCFYYIISALSTQ